MTKRTTKRMLALVSILLLLGLVQQGNVATADSYDSGVAKEAVVEELSAAEALASEVADETATDNTTAESTTTKKKGGNGFVRVIGAPFRALGRLFGGGKKNEQQVRRIDKDSGKFAGIVVSRIKDATTPVAPAPKSASAAPAASTDFQDHLNKGRELLLAGDVNGAIWELDAATAINSKSAEANRLLGVAYESKGFRQSALKSFEVAVQLEEKNAEHLNNLGYLLYKNGDYERATKYLKRAAKIAPKNARIWNNLGLAYCERGKFDDAYQSFAQASGEFSAHMTIAAELQRRAYARRAIEHLEEAQAMRPNSADVLAKLADLYQQTGRPTDAENARRAVVALKTFADANK